MAVLVTMTPNIFEYIWKSLNLKTSVPLYWKVLNCLNITYTIILMTIFDFKDLNYLILPKIDDMSNIKKIMIFVDNIEKNRALKIYL